MIIEDMPKLLSPFKRAIINGRYIVTPEIEPEYEWVFNDENVLAIEKLDGTNVSIIIEKGKITRVFNRTGEVPFFGSGKRFIIEGVMNSYERGYCNFTDGQYFGECVGPRIQGNPYNLTKPMWIPFNTFCKKHLRYKSWGKYPKDFNTISTWFKELLPLYSLQLHGKPENKHKYFVEGIVFTHPDGRMAKIRKDMFDWYTGKQHKEEEQENGT